MEKLFDIASWEELGSLPLYLIMWKFFIGGGWIIFDLSFLFMLKKLWKEYVQGIYASKRKFTLLAIDVPKDNELTPKNAENIFSQLAGAHGSINKWEEWWDGETQEVFSLEIVSIDGYVQFLIRTRDKFRDLVEAAVYAQYPDAEITEVADYVDAVPQKFPNDTHDFFGLEYTLHKPEAYPIRTYKEFIDQATGEFIDPMAALLEIMSKIGKGEQIWIQIVITPIDDKWKDEGEEIVKKLIGAKVEAKRTMIDSLIEFPIKVLQVLGDIIIPGEAAEAPKKKEDLPSKMLYLSPGEKADVEAIEDKLSKIGFRTKIRLMYIGRKEVFDKRRGVNPVIGAFKQFNTIGLNRFSVVKEVWTKADYAFAKTRKIWRQNKLMLGYVKRSNWRNWGKGVVYNIEELAGLYHFPVRTVKAPLVKKTESKKSEPPVGLPIEAEEREFRTRITRVSKKYFAGKERSQGASERVVASPLEGEIEENSAAQPPDNLPIE